MHECVGRDKSGFSKDESRRDGWHFCVICRLVCSCLCGRARKGDIHLVTTKDRVGVSSHLTPGSSVWRRKLHMVQDYDDHFVVNVVVWVLAIILVIVVLHCPLPRRVVW